MTFPKLTVKNKANARCYSGISHLILWTSLIIVTRFIGWGRLMVNSRPGVVWVFSYRTMNSWWWMLLLWVMLYFYVSSFGYQSTEVLSLVGGGKQILASSLRAVTWFRCYGARYTRSLFLLQHVLETVLLFYPRVVSKLVSMFFSLYIYIYSKFVINASSGNRFHIAVNTYIAFGFWVLKHIPA